MNKSMMIAMMAGGAALFGSTAVAQAGCGYGGYNGADSYGVPSDTYYVPSYGNSAPSYNDGPSVGYWSGYGYGYRPGISRTPGGNYGGYRVAHSHPYGRWGGGPGSANFHHYPN